MAVSCADVVPRGAAVIADLDLLAGAERAVGAGHRQRGVAGGEVRRAGVGGNRRDRQRLGRPRGVDGDGLAGGGADVAGGVDDPRLVSEARAVGGRVEVAPGRGGVLRDVVPRGAAVIADLDLLAGAERAVGAGHRQRGVAGGEVRRAGVGGNRRDRQRLGRPRGVDGDGLAGGGADVAGGVDDPRLVGEARAVGGRVEVAPGRGGVLRDVVPRGAAVIADLDLLAGAERAVGAGHRQRGVAGGEVRRAGVGGNRRDRQRLGRPRGVDGDGLAGGGADVAGGVDDPRLVSEARAVGGRVEVAPGRGGVLRDVVPRGAAVIADLDLLAGAERAVGAGHRQRGVAGGEVRRAGVGGNRRDRQRLGRPRAVDGDGLAGGGADVAGGVDDPRLVSEARAVGGRVEVAPGRGGVLRDVVPRGAAVIADLDLLAGAERAVGAGHRQRGVAGDEVPRRAGVVGNRRDRQRCRRDIFADGHCIGAILRRATGSSGGQINKAPAGN